MSLKQALVGSLSADFCLDKKLDELAQSLGTPLEHTASPVMSYNLLMGLESIETPAIRHPHGLGVSEGIVATRTITPPETPRRKLPPTSYGMQEVVQTDDFEDSPSTTPSSGHSSVLANGPIFTQSLPSLLLSTMPSAL